MEALVALSDGTVFSGTAFGAPGESLGEMVFNTSMTGYQEILTDPSYAGQIVCQKQANLDLLYLSQYRAYGGFLK